MSTPRRPAFTLVETAAVVTCVGALVALAQPGNSQPRSRQARDAAQVRGIHQGMVLFAQNNQDLYPFPSRVDRFNYTVPELGAAKDTSANVMSILVFDGLVPFESLVSPVERNDNIEPDFTYHYVAPPAAVNPALAAWDPAFSADFNGASPGNLSYAHLEPSGNRRQRWSNTFWGNEAVLSNRTPEVSSVEHNGEISATVNLADRHSNTLRMYGNAHTWSGHVVFNDNHVQFYDNRIGPGSTITPQTYSPVRWYYLANGERRLDLWCYDDPDDPNAVNDNVGIFTAAGPSPANFVQIWD